MKVVSFTPIKMNNERVPQKNTKPFDDGTPLIAMILKALRESKTVEESYVYCSNEAIKAYLPEDVHFLKRDPIYDTADADVNDMFHSFAEKVSADIYVLAHATAPFLSSESIDKGVEIVKQGAYDSVVSARKIQEFLWKDGKPMNYNTLKIPRSQDLPPIYIETTGMYIFTSEVIHSRKSKIGYNPCLLEVSEVEAIDINNPEDFELANMVYMSRYKGK